MLHALFHLLPLALPLTTVLDSANNSVVELITNLDSPNSSVVELELDDILYNISETLLSYRPEGLGVSSTYIKTTPYGPARDGFAEESYGGKEGVMKASGSSLSVKGNVRAYWVKDHTHHSWNGMQYKTLHLHGKKLRFTVDVSRVGCGCNAALYLVEMPSSAHSSSSGYCDIQGVGSRHCNEIDLFEGNSKAMQATLHTQSGTTVDGNCNQYGCAVNWGRTSHVHYGHGSMLDTHKPFTMEASFDEHGDMTIRVHQSGWKYWHTFWSTSSAGNPQGHGVPHKARQALQQTLRNGVVLTVSLWEAKDDMAWLNGNCNSQYPKCSLSSAGVVFSDIEIL